MTKPINSGACKRNKKGGRDPARRRYYAEENTKKGRDTMVKANINGSRLGGH